MDFDQVAASLETLRSFVLALAGRQPVAGLTLREVLDEFLAAKERAGRSV